MSTQKSCIGYPWILDAIAKYKGGIFTPKAAPAQVVEFLKMPVCSKECPYSGAIVHISDRKYYIRAIITEEAHETLEREDEHFTLASIKNKIIILKKFTLSFAAEEDLRCCEFILTIQHFSVLPMETNTVDILNCNMDPEVRKKIKELWQHYMAELQIKETMADLNSSDVSLTQLLMVANEEKLGSLKSLAEQCLDLDQYASQDISAQARTTWSIEMRKNKNRSVSFSVPINLLIIPPEEEAALEQMSELTANNNSTGDADDSSVEENASTQYSTAASTLSQESMEDACTGLSGNPWNNLLSPCITASAGSAVSESNKSGTQLSSARDIGVDSDATPELLKDYQEKCMNDPSESQELSPSLLSPLCLNLIVPEAETSTHLDTTSSSNAGLPSSQRKLTDSSPTVASLVPHGQDYPKDQAYSSPRKTLAVGSKVHISPLLCHSSESDCDIRLGGNNLSSDSTISRKSSASRVRRAVKRKQTPEDPDATLSDQEQVIPVCVEKLDCVADVARFPSKSLYFPSPNKSNKTQPEIASHGDERGTTAQSCPEKEPERRQVKRIGTESVKDTGTSPARKKAPPYKASLEFVAQPILTVPKNSENGLSAASMHTSKEASARGFQAPVVLSKGTKLTHSDGSSFQYKYKTPPADLCARVKALQMPTELCKWAKRILSDAKEKVP